MKTLLKSILALLMVTVALPAMGAKPAHKGTTQRKVTAREAAAEGENYASISRTNPFEIVPAAGMEILDLDSNEEMVNDMLNFARKFIGTRYVRGGKNPGGFDCSGFTSYVFSQFGYSLSASSAAQATQGEKISKDEISAGDLLFFTGRNSKSQRVGHVGIAIDNDPATGEITFIHAANGGGIRIDKVSAPYYSARFIGARRVL